MLLPLFLNLILLVEAIVSVLHVWRDVLLCVSLQRCSPVHEASVLSVLHGDLSVTTTIIF
jgi:hypothetical protein